jgi:flagellar assembly protein FliH
MSIDSTFSPASYPSLKNTALDALEQRSRAAGHSAGYAAGLRAAAHDAAAAEERRNAELAAAAAEGQARVEHAVAVLEAAAEALNRRTMPLLSDAQDALAATAVELAEAIIGVELRTGDTSATSALRRALADVDALTVQVIRLNPQDLAALDPETIAAAGVSLEADASLAPGDAVSQFADGFLDARISTAMRRARDAILEVGP